MRDQVPLEQVEFLPLPGEGGALRRHVTAQRAYYEWVVDGRARSPLIKDAFARLEELWPRAPGIPVLNRGDARIGNIVCDGFEPTAVLDREMAALASPEVDLGWTVCLHRFFQDLTVTFGQRGPPDFLPRPHRGPLMPTSPATRPTTWTSTRCTRPCGTPS
ncbi:phosphotransferase [Streptomyces sp. AC550_RSS872]|uniref:phosphotransferase n=1 Tax=Streptomyces sp. AC550_RSS872 TaxID=2823689 RepID=UPI0035AB9D07